MIDKARQNIQPFIDWITDNSKIDKSTILYSYMETYLAEIKSETSDKPALNIANVSKSFIDYSKVRAEAEKQADKMHYIHGVGDRFKDGFKDGFEKGVKYISK